MVFDVNLGAFSDPAPDPGPQLVGAPSAKVPYAPPSAVRPVDYREFHRRAYGDDGESRVCSARKTSTLLYGAFIEIVRNLYRLRSPHILGVPAVKWSDDVQRTGIWIDSDYRWNQDNPEFLPAIYVSIPEIRYQSELGFANMSVGMVLKDAVYQYQRSGSGSVSFTHVSGTAGEAMALCDNTRAYLSDFCGPISEDLCLDEFQEASVKPIAPAQKDSRDRYMSSTTFSFSFHEEWEVKMDSPILRSVDLLQESTGYGILSTERDVRARGDQPDGGSGGGAGS